MITLSLPRRIRRPAAHPYPDLPHGSLSVTEAIAALDEQPRPAPRFTPAALRETRPVPVLAEAQEAFTDRPAFTRHPDALRAVVTALRGGEPRGEHPFAVKAPAHAKSSARRTAGIAPLPRVTPRAAVMTAAHSREWTDAVRYPACDATSASTVSEYAALMARISLVTGTTSRYEDRAAWGTGARITAGPGTSNPVPSRSPWMSAAWCEAYAEISTAHAAARRGIRQDAYLFAEMERHRAEAADAAPAIGWPGVDL